MKMYIQNIKKPKSYFTQLALLSSITLVLGMTSCTKIDDVQPMRLAAEEYNWKSFEDGRANLMSVYGLMRSATVADNGHWLMGDLRQGDFTITNRSDLKAIVKGQLNASYPVMNRISNWRRFYAVINAASLFIERSSEILASDRRYTETNNKVDIAQARLIRAFAYFYMCRIWGDVPLLTSSHDGLFPVTARVSQDKVLAYATREILEAAKVLPFRYGGTDPILPGTYYSSPWTGWNGNVFTRISAYIILAHIAAWQQNYIDAEAYTKFVMDNYTSLNGDGSLGIAYLDMNALTENNNTYSPFAYKRATVLVGFPFESGNGYSTANGHIEQLTLAKPFVPREHPEMYVSKDSIIQMFKHDTDLRFGIDPQSKRYRTNYFYGFESELPIFNKIKVLSPDRTSGHFMMYSSTMLFSRLEEITLLRAEALAVLGDEDGAFQALNQACEKRGISFAKADTPDLIEAIFQERRRELMGEGWRWYDQIRYQRIKKSPAIFDQKKGLTFRDFERAGGIYWPVSPDVTNTNTLVKQNPYWE